MKLKQLEGLLGGLTQFPDPKVELEQYPTGPHIASRMLYTAENSFDDIMGKLVADFGCGCGTLAVASALLDADHLNLLKKMLLIWRLLLLKLSILYTRLPLENISRRQPCVAATPAVRRFYASCVTIYRRRTSSTRKRRSTLPSTRGALFLTPNSSS
ncbi:uncharacterized protein [Miscanthus floridulus]|uniref:uncharacterized protein n=1 Tax=Miscanthus floridulus TaxID=154761 RepID=UPI003457FC81